MQEVFMLLGFLFAAYSIVANDSIQTLGTFLNSNDKRAWWQLWLFAGGILAAVVLYGWAVHNGDPSYGRLSKIPLPTEFTWVHVLPPVILLFLTRFGFPVSTTFLVLTLFSQKALGPMLQKSILGYFVAFIGASVIYFAVSKIYQKHFLNEEKAQANRKFWIAAQWVSTAFLWSQWLIQDLANIFVYLPRQLSFLEISSALAVMLLMTAFIFYNRGGEIQKIVSSKTNTADIRSATMIDLIFAFMLFYFKGMNKVPMSTTWVFIGLLAGRELAINMRLKLKNQSEVWPVIGKDIMKATGGLAVSVILALSLPILTKMAQPSKPSVVEKIIPKKNMTSKDEKEFLAKQNIAQLDR